MSLGKARGSTGGPSAFPSAKIREKEVVFFKLSLCFACFSNIYYLFSSSHEDHIVGQEPHSLGILKMQTEFWILFQEHTIVICKHF